MIPQSPNLFVVFPGAAGGNHLLNIISLSSKFTKRIAYTTDYQTELLNVYRDRSDLIKKTGNYKKAHFTYEDLSVPAIEIQSEYNNKQDPALIKLFSAHQHMLYEWGHLPNLTDNSFFLLMTYPSANSLPGKRIIEYGDNWEWAKDSYSFSGLNKAPQGSNINWSLNINKQNYIELDTELFWKEDGCDYLASALNLTLPKIAKDIHLVWLSWFESIAKT